MSLVVVVAIVTAWPGIGMGIALGVLAGSQCESSYLPRALEPRVIRFNEITPSSSPPPMSTDLHVLHEPAFFYPGYYA